MWIAKLEDTGAAVSVVRYDVLGDYLQQRINATHSATFGANGLPLEVLGQATIPLVLIFYTHSQYQFLAS